MKVWQYVVLLHPTEKEKEVGVPTKLVVEVETVISPDQNGAVMQAARKIPAEYMSFAGRLEVVVRPFERAAKTSETVKAAPNYWDFLRQGSPNAGPVGVYRRTVLAVRGDYEWSGSTYVPVTSAMLIQTS